MIKWWRWLWLPRLTYPLEYVWHGGKWRKRTNPKVFRDAVMKSWEASIAQAPVEVKRLFVR